MIANGALLGVRPCVLQEQIRRVIEADITPFADFRVFWNESGSQGRGDILGLRATQGCIDCPDETFTVGLSGVTGGASLGTATSTVSIVDNDAVQPGTLSISPAAT